MSITPDKAMQCPICLETMTAPILQCKNGHSMCGDCITANSIILCPECRGPMTTTRSYRLEQLIESVRDCLKMKCFFHDRGCKFLLTFQDKDAHEAECKHRTFRCEGQVFANWKCNWSGQLSEMHNHFKQHHNNHTWAQYRTEAIMKISLESDFKDVQMISYFDGAQFFWYKHEINVAKQKAYWTFQFIGPSKQAKNYYYEFEVSQGSTRKFKVTEICENDVVKDKDIFESEKCVVMSFAGIRSFWNENHELSFKFRVMSIKKPTGNSK